MKNLLDKLLYYVFGKLPDKNLKQFLERQRKPKKERSLLSRSIEKITKK